MFNLNPKKEPLLFWRVFNFNAMEEVWKNVTGYEGLYQVSNLGRLKSLSRFNSRTERILRPIVNSKGYSVCSLSKENIKKIHSIHRLVGEYFILNPESKPEINHIDGIKQHNYESNLEWCTSSENKIHAFKTGLQKPNSPWTGRFGINHNRSKQIKQITKEGIFVESFENAKHAEKTTGINSSGIADVCRGTSKTAGGYKWEYA